MKQFKDKVYEGLVSIAMACLLGGVGAVIVLSII
jgi:hypothetical protein